MLGEHVPRELSFFFQAEDGIRDLVRSRGLGDVYKRQMQSCKVMRQKPGQPGRAGRRRGEAGPETASDETGGTLHEHPDTGLAKSTASTGCLLYTSPSPRDRTRSRMPSSA